MRVSKKHFIFAGGTILAVWMMDQPRRQVPLFWQTGLGSTGASHFVIRREGDITLKFVSAALGAGDLELVPVSFYQESGPGTSSIKEIVRRFSLVTKQPVLAAINGGFFDVATGSPIGFLLRDGHMDFFNMPQGFQRSMVGFSPAGKYGKGPRVSISSPRQMPKVWLYTPSGSVAVHHINIPGGRHALSLFTPVYGSRVRLPEKAIYLIAQAETGKKNLYRISGIQESGSAAIPAGGLVVALHGDSRAKLSMLKIGALIRPHWTLPSDWAADGVTHGLLAGPRLLERGHVQVTAKAERLDTLKSRDRVALAVAENGLAVLVWAHKNSGTNLTFEELAGVLLKMGATDAIAFDGGRSRAILAQAGGAPADERYFEGGRPVANALVLAVKSVTRS